MERSLQILRDRPEGGDRFPRLPSEGPDRIFQAVVQVALDERAFGVGDRLLDRMELLGDVEAGLAALDHGNHASKMSLGPHEPLDDLRVGFVPIFMFNHRAVLSPGGDISIGNIVFYCERGYQGAMLRRLQSLFTRTVTAVMACLAILVYASAFSAKHAPDLHASSLSVGLQTHGHDQGDHARDDWDVADPNTINADHHHADHTHDTAGLVGLSDVSASPVRQPKHLTLSFPLLGGPPFEIERPPRSMT